MTLPPYICIYTLYMYMYVSGPSQMSVIMYTCNIIIIYVEASD